MCLFEILYEHKCEFRSESQLDHKLCVNRRWRYYLTLALLCPFLFRSHRMVCVCVCCVQIVEIV